jgi:hypothetical protein
MKVGNPVIVVVAYNRADSLNRILNSLLHSRNIDGADLIISIDNRQPYNDDVREVADEFAWPFGAKEVRYQKEHLGLRKHIMRCGDLSMQYGSVIILEDDLLVSPYFYDFAKASLAYYINDDTIGGISLYNQPRQEIVKLPFTPLIDSSDVYFLQFPSSLGQLWTAAQWKGFRSWMETDPDLSSTAIPDYILHWPESSWKKYFAAYLVESNKYFVYPRISLTTNFFDVGSNVTDASSHRGQTPLRMFSSSYQFSRLAESDSVYDIHLELEPGCVKKLSVAGLHEDFEMDLYGSKELKDIKAPYVITSRPCTNRVKGYRRALKPHEMNILLDIEGDDLNLCRKEDVIFKKKDSEELLAEFGYYYTDFIKGTKFMIYRYFRKRKWLKKLFK